MPRIKVADNPSMEGSPRKQVDFSKAQGSSRNDEADLLDVARKAANKSQVHRQPDHEPSEKSSAIGTRAKALRPNSRIPAAKLSARCLLRAKKIPALARNRARWGIAASATVSPWATTFRKLRRHQTELRAFGSMEPVTKLASSKFSAQPESHCAHRAI